MVKVIPPGSTFASTTLNFEYTYDPADNILTQKVPDAALVTMKYNTRDQLALEQDGNLLALNKWRCMQYDDYGRVLKTGLYAGAVPSPIPTIMAPTDLYTENIYGTTGIEKGKVKTAKVKVFDTPPTWLTTLNAASLGGTNTGLAACPIMPSPGTASATRDLNDLFYLELKYDVLQSGLTGTAFKNGKTYCPGSALAQRYCSAKPGAVRDNVAVEKPYRWEMRVNNVTFCRNYVIQPDKNRLNFVHRKFATFSATLQEQGNSATNTL
jgi:hypothetical protein